MAFSLMALAFSLVAGLAQTTSARTFAVVNACPFTIWPAMFTDLTVAPNVPQFPTGWQAAPSNSVSFEVPDNWKSGRIWGRRGCDFSTNPGPNSCLDGGCNGGLLCDPHTGTGVPPATVAEWTLQGDGGRDFYDVSLVDGYNLPMAITNNANCPVADCPVDLGPDCPSPLIGPFDSTGFPVGCKSACSANLDGTPNDSANCCSGSHSTAATCPSSGIAFYSYFKGNCPNSYAYAFDESSNTALWTCNSSANPDFTLTFCPPTNASASVSASVSASSIPGTTAVSASASTSASSSLSSPPPPSGAPGTGTSETIGSSVQTSTLLPARSSATRGTVPATAAWAWTTTYALPALLVLCFSRAGAA